MLSFAGSETSTAKGIGLVNNSASGPGVKCRSIAAGSAKFLVKANYQQLPEVIKATYQSP